MKNLLIILSILLIIVGLYISWEFFEILGQHYNYRRAGKLEIDATGQTGEFIGGVVGTIFSLAGFVMLLLTIRQQNDSFQKERFETNFFELLKIHRENVIDLKKQISNGVEKEDFEGRKVIQLIVSDILKCREEINMFFRLRNEKDIYEKHYADKLKATFKYTNPKVDLAKLAKINIPYCIVFFGIDGEGRKILDGIFKDKYNPKFYKPLLDYISLKPIRERTEYFNKWETIRSITDYKKRKIIGLGILSRRRTTYKPEDYEMPIRQQIEELWYKNDFVKYYGGNQYRLGHYFRHLYQTVTFIDSNKKLKTNMKYFYLKTLRAQLSTHEQVLLFFNSLSFIGMVWELTPKYKSDIYLEFINYYRAKRKMLISKYQFIKNIPSSDIFGLKILEFYPLIELETNESYLCDVPDSEKDPNKM